MMLLYGNLLFAVGTRRFWSFLRHIPEPHGTFPTDVLKADVALGELSL